MGGEQHHTFVSYTVCCLNSPPSSSPPTKHTLTLVNDTHNTHSTAALQWLLQQLATLKLKTGNVDAALQLYTELHAHTGTTAGGLRVLSRLASVLALRQPDAVEQLQKNLPVLRVSLDGGALETEALGV